MKFISYFGFLILVFGSLYLSNHLGLTYESQHPTLNEHSIDTDMQLNNVRHYLKEDLIERSLFHLDGAITSLRSIQNDTDLETGKEIELTIHQLDVIYNEILAGEKPYEEMNSVFEKTLNLLALVELRVSEKYAESNDLEHARLALTYAKLHLKNGMNYSSLPDRKYEYHVYKEIDSIMLSNSNPPVVVTEKIDKMIQEMDALLVRL